MTILQSDFNSSHTSDEDILFVRRKRVIITLILGSLTIFGFAAFLTSLLGHIIYYHPGSSFSGLTVSGIFSISTILLYLAVRKGRYTLGAITVLTLLSVITLSSTVFWSFELPNSAILTALTIIVGGILLNDKQSKVFSVLILLAVLCIGFGEVTGLIHPYLGWSEHILEGGDLFGLLVILFLITQVTWISNHEIDISFRRAKNYELILAAERDNLEIKVRERTKQIEQMQLERSLQLQKFIEFGKLTSGIVHDLASPLTTASLSIQLLEEQGQTKLVKEARKNIDTIERYIRLARDQLKKESHVKTFYVDVAINEVIELVSHRSMIAGVQIISHFDRLELYGDMTRFQQLVSNLLLNAIDAYTLVDAKEKSVRIMIKNIKNGLTLTITDYGIGIPLDEIDHIFEPFYSTKPPSRGTGLGLMLSKQISEEVFMGSLVLLQKKGLGTSFIATLYNAETTLSGGEVESRDDSRR